MADKKKEKKILQNSHSICHECATSRGAKCDRAVTCWRGECCLCKRIKSCCAVTDYHWPKKYDIGYVFD